MVCFETYLRCVLTIFLLWSWFYGISVEILRFFQSWLNFTNVPLHLDPKSVLNQFPKFNMPLNQDNHNLEWTLNTLNLWCSDYLMSNEHVMASVLSCQVSIYINIHYGRCAHPVIGECLFFQVLFFLGVCWMRKCVVKYTIHKVELVFTFAQTCTIQPANCCLE